MLACGRPYTGPFQVPIVAWHLRVHARRVRLDAQRPAVIFRAKSNPDAPVVPDLAPVGGEAGVRTFAAGSNWRIVGACRGGGG